MKRDRIRDTCRRPERHRLTPRVSTKAGVRPGVTSDLLFANLGSRPVVGSSACRDQPRGALQCRACRSSRSACWRPDQRRRASAPGSRSRGRAATLVDAHLAAGKDEQEPRSLATRSKRSGSAPSALVRAVAASCQAAPGCGRLREPIRALPQVAYKASPALACIIGARRAWTAEMISSEEMPCGYVPVVDR